MVGQLLSSLFLSLLICHLYTFPHSTSAADRGCGNSLLFQMFHEEVGDDGGHWATHGCAKFLLVYRVSECEISCVQNKVQ